MAEPAPAAGRATLGPCPAAAASNARPHPHDVRAETTRALGARLGRGRRGRATWSACGATSARARRSSRRASGAGLGVDRHDQLADFILMAEYAGRLPLFHVDLYRLADAADALAGGVIDERQADGRHGRRVARADGRRPAGRPARRRDRRQRRRAADDRRCGTADAGIARYVEAAAR